MPLQKLPYHKLERLIVDHLSTYEEENTLELIREFRMVKKRGYLTKSELEHVCYWKSERAIWLIRENSPYLIRKRTGDTFATRSERKKLDLLTSLKGVSVPMASAVLMLHNPKKYGVIDTRAWELLYTLGTVKTNSRGAGFRFNEWYRYLVIIRYFANKLHVNARDIERTLFKVHKAYQEGTLYQLKQ